MPAIVLLIEDDEDSVEILSRFLRHHGLDVRVARDGEEGLRSAREVRPDLVLLDLAMPKLSGWEVARSLRDDPRTRDVPILAVTALALAEERGKADGIRLDGYYAKPIEPSRLLLEMTRFLPSDAP